MSKNSMQLIQQFGVSKTTINEVANTIAELVKSGNEEPLLLLANMKSMENLIKAIKSKIEPEVSDAMHAYPEKSFTKHGVTFTKTIRKTYDYSDNDEWLELNTKRKELEVQLKAMSKPMADPDSGEMIYPPVFKQSEGVTIKLKQ